PTLMGRSSGVPFWDMRSAVVCITSKSARHGYRCGRSLRYLREVAMALSTRPISESSPQPTSVSSTSTGVLKPQEDFAAHLAFAQTQNLRFSNHAQKRLQSRQIDLSVEDLARLSQAVEKAAQRGG